MRVLVAGLLLLIAALGYGHHGPASPYSKPNPFDASKGPGAVDAGALVRGER